ncbi:TetR/AcrR family transcriptional regulator [Devosia sp. FKR38]|uniref:TetR/AcrR family transcriptional regulator n=1 Tax=Devosia sp. FKR38 TaxID=2562312 RepID=UPI0010C0CA05|nr:TetR/AcrR family transcriptional regulator [Devosia sp. FKR38]
MPARPASPKPAHSHPNLREALIDAGLTLLASEGTSGLTLRKCAALAGVSHAAPAHHFAGLPGLLTAIATRGFRIFAQTMLEDAAAAPDTPRARLYAICTGYYRFAFEHPALFDLMFRQMCAEPVTLDDAELMQASDAAYGVLAQACAPFVQDGQAAQTTQFQVWSLIHGYACLALANKYAREEFSRNLPALLSLLDKLELKA